VKLTEASLGNPVAVLVAVLLIALFGGISLGYLPVQLTPEIQEPQITITTTWRAAAPNEVEADIVEPQENVLRGTPGMTELLGQAQEGRGVITITFAVDMDLRRALVEVLNRLNQVPSYPGDADEPTISTVGGDARAIAWFVIKTAPGNDRDISSYKDFVEEVVQTRFERIPGVARSEVYGGREHEIRITFDPYRAASLGIELPVISRLAGTSKDISGGFADVGKREFSLRYAGKYSIRDLNELIIHWREGRPVYLRDVAAVEQVKASVGKDHPLPLPPEVGARAVEHARPRQDHVARAFDGQQAAAAHARAILPARSPLARPAHRAAGEAELVVTAEPIGSRRHVRPQRQGVRGANCGDVLS